MLRPSHVLVAFGLLTFGCEEDLGPCDSDAAFEIVYDQQGIPAFAGQALVIQSCGGGAFCHSAGIEPEARFSTPAGLDFDLRLASTTSEVELESVHRLGMDQERLYEHRQSVPSRVGPEGVHGRGDEIDLLVRTLRTYDRFDDSGAFTGSLPDSSTAEGAEVLRNWLACGVPVLERTTSVRLPMEETVGYVAPSCDRDCVDVTWPEIYARVIEPSCASTACHSGSSPGGRLDLRTGGAVAVLDRLIDVTSSTLRCGSLAPSQVVPGDADASLFYRKVAAVDSDDVCGGRMPVGGPRLSEQRLCAIRTWIDCGACPEADGGACADCLAAGRAECSVDLAAPNLCSAPAAACSNRL